MIGTETEFEVIELPALDASVPCDIGHYTNRHSPPCPHEATWRLAYVCCMASSLMCDDHKDQFLRHVAAIRHEARKCTRCGRVSIVGDVLLVEPL